MRHFLSIAIFSALSVSSFGQTTGAFVYRPNNSLPFLQWQPVAGITGSVKVRFVWTSGGGGTVERTWNSTVYSFTSFGGSFSPTSAEVPFETIIAAEFKVQNPDGTYPEEWSVGNTIAEPEPTPTPPPLEEYSFEKEFGSEFGGSTVEILDADGNVLGSWTIPVGGTVLAASVSADSLDGAYWRIDGVVTGDIDDPAADPFFATARSAYEFRWGESYAGSEWKIERSDGTIAFSGISDPGNTDVGRVTIAQGDEAVVWTRTPLGDGNGGTWVPTPVKLNGGGTASYVFTDQTTPTNTVPTSTPPPPPTLEPLPAPGATTTNITPNPIAPEDVVNVEVPDPVELDGDFGAQQVVDALGVFGQIALGYENFAEAFQNAALTFNEFKNMYLPPPGSTCELQFGETTINLSRFLPGWVRGASKLVFLLVALGAMKRFIEDVMT